MPPALTFRRAAAGEASALCALAVRSKASHGYDQGFMRLVVEDFESVITEEMVARDTVQVAEMEGRVVGFAHLMPCDRPDTIYLEDLFIEPDAQGLGVGRALFDWAWAEAGQRGYDWLEWDSDPNATPFYEKMGGVQIGGQESTSLPGRFIPKFRRAARRP